MNNDNHIVVGLSRMEKLGREMYRLHLYVDSGHSTAKNLYNLLTDKHGYCNMPAYKAHPQYVMVEGDQFTIDVTSSQAEYIVESISREPIEEEV